MSNPTRTLGRSQSTLFQPAGHLRGAKLIRIDRVYFIGFCSAAMGLALAVSIAHHRGVAFGLPLDDGWIHAAFAKNLALDHTWGLLAGERSGGESSLLWPAVLALGELGGAGLAPVLSLALGAMSFLALPGLVGHLASIPARGRVVAVAIGLCGPLLFAALSGMETVPALSFGTAALVFLRRGHVGRAAICTGIAAMLRPDALLLIPVLAAGAASTALKTQENSLPDLLHRWLRLWPAAVFAILVITSLSLLEQHFPPATLAGRRWIVGLPQEVDLSQAPAGFLELCRQWVNALFADLGAGRVLDRLPFAPAWRTTWACAAIFGTALGLFSSFKRSSARTHLSTRLLFAWTILALVFYAVVLPDRGHAGRYQPQVYVCFIVLAVEGICALAAMSLRMAPLAFAAAGIFGAGIAITEVETADLWCTAVDHINNLHVSAAAQIEGITAPDDLVAVFDVGAVAYARSRKLLDISG